MTYPSFLGIKVGLMLGNIPGTGYKIKPLSLDFVTYATAYGAAIPCPCEEGSKFTIRTLGDFPCNLSS